MAYGVFQEGYSAWNFYLPVFMGVDSQTGKPIYDDGNGNPVMDVNRAANIMLTDKKYVAPINGGFNINVGWKGITLSANFAYVLNKWLFNSDRYFTDGGIASLPGMARPDYMKNIWKQAGDISDIPRYGETYLHSTQFLEDASFLRLKNLMISYTLPGSWMQKTGFIQSARIYAIGRNLFTISKYTGYDPEYAGAAAIGIYPNARQLSIGVELIF